jgi:[protein-PII] uridylyltransferase
VSPAEGRLLARNETVIKRIRAALHVCAGRREDRLVFDLQAQAARLLGVRQEDGRRASEELMQRSLLGGKGRDPAQLDRAAAARGWAVCPARCGPEPIDAEFRNVQGSLDMIDPDLFERDPAAILRAFLALQQHSCRG